MRFDSDIALDELAPADDPGERRAIVRVRRGWVPDRLGGAIPPRHGLQAAGDDLLLAVPGVARYLIRGDRAITVDAEPDAADRDVRLFLLGSVLGLLGYRRGLLPLHANAIAADGGAVAFAGPSGAGKSTLAAWFAARGYGVLADDVCLVRHDTACAPIAWPGPPRLRLWRDAAIAFGHDPARLDRAIAGLDKYHAPITVPAPAPLPLRRLYVLDRGERRAIVRLRGADALGAMIANGYRTLYLPILGLTAWHFHACARLLATVEVFAVRRRWGYDRLDEDAAWIEAHMRGGVEAGL